MPYQIACAYEDGNDANALRTDPVFKRGLERKPLDEDADRTGAPTFSRQENAATPQALYRLAQAFVDQFIASYAQPPAVIVLDMDHSDRLTTFHPKRNIRSKWARKPIEFPIHSYCYAQ